MKREGLCTEGAVRGKCSKAMERDELIRQIKRNCDISDAGFWGFYSICGLLTRLRELYLSEHEMMPWDSIPKEEMSTWIHERENLWKTLEGEDARPLMIDGISYDPFDVDRLNGILKGTGLIYGSGYGAFNKKTFFLGKLDAVNELFDYRVHAVGGELCRDLSAFPAMLQGRCIYIRFDPLRSLLWDKFQESRSVRHCGILEKMFSQFGVMKTDPVSEGLFEHINRIAHEISDLFVLHEVGEAFEDDNSDEWLDMLQQEHDMYTEFSLRGTKDLLADTSEKGPLKAVIQRRDYPLLVSYLAFLSGIRREMFPEIRGAFDRFSNCRDWSLIEQARIDGYGRAVAMRANILTIWKETGSGKDFVSAVRKYYQSISGK